MTLEEYVRSMGGGYKAIKRVFDDVYNRRLELIDPDPPKTFIDYICRGSYSLWLWTSIFIVVLTIVLIQVSEFSLVLRIIRYVLGSIIVLFLPGYATIEALYPRDNELTDLERVALSIGLSLAITPLIGLLLNYTPWGIRLYPILLSLALYIIVMLFLAAYRKYSLSRRSSIHRITRSVSKKTR